MPDILAAFPSRPLRARPPRRIWPLMQVLFAFGIFGAMLTALLVFVLPDLVLDWQVRGTAVPIQGARLMRTDCKGRGFLDICDATVSAPLASATASAPGAISGSTTVTRKVALLFGSLGESRLGTRVVGDPARPELLTVAFGLERFWNRVLCAVAAVAGLLLVLAGWSRGFITTVRTRRSWLEADAVPVPLQLVKRSGGSWTLRTESGRELRWDLPRFARPFVLGPSDVVLGLASRGGAVFPLDSRLRWVTLSPTERAAIRAAQPSA